MKTKFRFVGSEAEIGEMRLDRLGQEIELDEETATAIVHRPCGAALITAAQFDQLGFTSDELDRYAFPGARANAPESFVAKLHAAHALVADQQAQYVEPTPEATGPAMGKRRVKETK